MEKPKHKIRTRVAGCISDKVKSIDRFGIPISFNFQKDTEFNTAIGGCTSFMLLIGLAMYAAILLKQLINKENSGLLNIIIRYTLIIF